MIGKSVGLLRLKEEFSAYLVGFGPARAPLRCSTQALVCRAIMIGGKLRRRYLSQRPSYRPLLLIN